MDVVELLDYKDIRPTLHDAKLLVGNGFSIACCPSIFTYRALLENADFSALSPEARTIFQKLETNDFELVIKTLSSTAEVAEHYGTLDSGLIQTLRDDASGLKEQLALSIAKGHPEHPSEITESQYRACRSFLTSFRKIYSLNYDLLLYWAIMRDEDGLPPVQADDGFRRGELGECGYVAWDMSEARSQDIYYLHGALHLFDRGSEFVKFTWTNTDVRLIQQIRMALSEGRFPRIVSEGTSDEKLSRISHCAYLARGLQSLQQIGHDLVVFGMSLMDNDDHILHSIAQSKLERVFIGIFGDPSSPANQNIITRAQSLTVKRKLQNDRKGQREKKHPLEVNFFSSESAHAWG